MSQFYQLGGAESLQVELAEELNKRGIHADILSMYSESLNGALKAKKNILEKGIPSVYFIGMQVHPSIYELILAVYKLRRIIIENKYDIIETSLLSPTVIASLSVIFTPVRHVAGIHQVFRKDRENSTQHRLWKCLAKLTFKTRYYAISDYVSESWVRYSGIPIQKITRIYNSIDNNYFVIKPDRYAVRKELKLKKDACIALYVGRLAAYKGIKVVLDALYPLIQKGDIYLVYAGLPDFNVNETKKDLQSMECKIINSGLTSKVLFLGYRKDTARLMASADILVHPTTIEGFGLTLVESMAARLQIVTSNVEAIPEILAGTNIITIPPDNPKILREAVIKTLHRSSKEKLDSLNIGFKRACEFKIDRRVDKMIALFEDILSG